MRVNIFKRLESSVNSFALTVGRILDKNSEMLKTIEKGSDYSLDDDSFDSDLDDDI